MENSKKQIVWFLLIAYGVTFLMGIPLWIGHKAGVDLIVFPTAQMIYPAAGVAAGMLLVNKGKDNIPKGFMLCVIITAAILAVTALISVVAPCEISTGTGATTSLYNLLSQVILIFGSIAGIICFAVVNKEKREAAGLRWKKTKSSILLILLFIGLYMVRTIISLLYYGIQDSDVAGAFSEWLAVFKDPLIWLTIVLLPVSFVFAYIAFFGEEYGWRYYLQPYLQSKFGLRLGVLVLGVVWGLWHIPIDLFYYTQTTPWQMVVAQQVTCISIAIFFAYAYMKTGNIWVPVIMHFLNNNLIPIITGNLSSDVLENQEVAWSDIPVALVINGVVFCLFIFSNVFNAKKHTPEQE